MNKHVSDINTLLSVGCSVLIKSRSDLSTFVCVQKSTDGFRITGSGVDNMVVDLEVYPEPVMVVTYAVDDFADIDFTEFK